MDNSYTIDEDSGDQVFDVLDGDFVRPNSTAELVSVSSILLTKEQFRSSITA